MAGHKAIESLSLFDTPFSGVAQGWPNSLLEFELQFTITAPLISDQITPFFPSSDDGHRMAEPWLFTWVWAEDGEHSTFAFSMTFPNETFDETLGDGRGPTHGFGFSLLNWDCFDGTEQLNITHPTLPFTEWSLITSDDMTQLETNTDAKPNEPKGEDIDNLSRDWDSWAIASSSDYVSDSLSTTQNLPLSCDSVPWTCGCGCESASRRLVDFGVLNNNLIKGLISCVKYMSRF
jgi:hypothetical protein